MRETILLAALSDIHGYFPTILTVGDVICICGDIIPKEIDRDLKKSYKWFATAFLDWIKKIKYQKVLLVPGNHDLVLQEMGDNINKTIEEYGLSSKLTILCDMSFEYGGWLFYGTPWVTNLPRWAFNTDDPQEKFEKIPYNCNILLTHHAPDFGKLGCSYPNTDKEIDFGCTELTNAIKKRPSIKYHFCGHIHTGNHEGVKINNATSYNVSITDEQYNLCYKPKTIYI